MKKLFAALLILAGAALPWLLQSGKLSETAAEKPKIAAPVAFHLADSPKPPAVTGPCAGCHGKGPHLASPRLRAFLNLHTGKVGCQQCHGGRAETLPEVKGREHRFPGGEAFQPRGPGCRECHQRGAKQLASITDTYRRQLLEELEVLEHLEGAK